jgi:COP9 signalosome complex subunit 2
MDMLNVVCLLYRSFVVPLYCRINPFDDQSTKAYERDPAVTVMTQLSDAYLARDIAAFEPLFKANEQSLMSDEFMRTYLSDLLFGIRSQAALNIVQPYSRVLLPRLATEIGVSPAEAEYIVAGLILDGRLNASIDQPTQVLTMHGPSNLGDSGQPQQQPQASAKAISGASASAAATTSSSASAKKAAPRGAAAGTDAAAKYAEITSVASKLSRYIDTLVSNAANAAPVPRESSVALAASGSGGR